MKARRVQEGKTIDYTPEADVAAGDVVVLGDRCFFANLDIPAGMLGALATGGVFDIAKGDGEIALGAVLYWDAANGTATTSAGGGTSSGGDTGETGGDTGETGGDTGETDAGNTRLGIAILAAASDDTTVRVLV